MCTRQRAGRLDRAPWVNGDPHNVECLIATCNGYQLAFGAPIRDAMNGEIKLTTGVLGLNTQDGVDMVLDTPIINDGSNGQLVLLIINIEAPSKLKPMLHRMSNRKDKKKFMAAHHITLNSNRTSDQSMALKNMIHRKQMEVYNKGLGLLTYEQRLANYKNCLALLPYEQCLANSKTGGKACIIDHLITKVEMHDLAMGDTVVHGNYDGTGIVKTVRAPTSNDGGKGKTSVQFHDEQVGIKDVYITSLCCNGFEVIYRV